MSENRLVKKKHLQEVTTDLWEKAKDKFAHVNAPNYFTETNTFEDLNMIVSYKSADYTDDTGAGNSGTNIWLGLKNIHSGLFKEGYVSHIRLYLFRETQGDVTGVRIFTVDVDTNTIGYELPLETSYPVQDDGMGTKYIDIPIGQHFQDKTAFMIRREDGAGYMIVTSLKKKYKHERIGIDGSTNIQEGMQIPHVYELDYIPRYEVYGIGNVESYIDDSVKTWQDLDEAYELPYTNQLELSRMIVDKKYDTNGDIVEEQNWGCVEVTVKPDTDYTMLRRDELGADSRRIVFFKDDGSRVVEEEGTRLPTGRYYHYKKFQTDADVTKIGVNVKLNHMFEETVMIIEGDAESYGGDVIPYSDDRYIFITDEVAHGFDNEGTDLLSSTISGAIKEINSKTKNYIDNVSLEVEGIGEAKKNVLKSYKGNQSTVVAKHIVTEWDDLEYTSKVAQKTYKNVFNKNEEVIDEKRFDAQANTFVQDTEFRVAFVPCKKLDTITIIKDEHDNSDFGVFENNDGSGQALQTFVGLRREDVDGKQVYRPLVNAQTLQDNKTYYLAINMKKTNPKIDENTMMAIIGDVPRDNVPREYIPHSTHGSIFINGEEVVMSFEPKNSGLKSGAVADAIRELALKQATGAGVNRIEYVEGEQKLKYYNNDTFIGEADLKDLASQKTNDNLFTTHTGFHNGYIKGRGMDYVVGNPNPDIKTLEEVYLNQNSCWWATESLTIEKNLTITDLIVGVSDDYKVGELVKNIKVRVAKNRVDDGQDVKYTVGDFVFDGIAMVKDNTVQEFQGKANKVVVLPINKRFDEDVVLMIQVPKSLACQNQVNTIYCQSGGQGLDTLQDEVVFGKSNAFYYGFAKVISQDIPFEDLINVDKPIQIEDVYQLRDELDNKVPWDKTTFGVDDNIKPAEGLVVKLNADGKVDDSLIDFPTRNTRIELDSFTQEKWDATGLEFFVGDIIYARDTEEYYHCIYDETTEIEQGFVPFQKYAVSKKKPNEVENKTVLYNGYILGTPVHKYNLTANTPDAEMETNKYCGSRGNNKTTNGVEKVRHISLPVHNDFDSTTTPMIDSVSVALVKRVDNNYINDVVLEKSVVKNVAIVDCQYPEFGTNKMVTVPISCDIQTGVSYYVLAGFKGMALCTNPNTGQLSFHNTGVIPNKDATMNGQSQPLGTNKVMNYIVHGEEIRLDKLGTGNLSTINGQQPIDGNIDLSVNKDSEEKISLRFNEYEFGDIVYMTEEQVNSFDDIFI